jgi:hypothetical protein
VNSIRRWWQTLGRARYPEAKRLVVTADGGGSKRRITTIPRARS